MERKMEQDRKQTQILKFEKQQVRIELDDDGDPLFCASDVARVLGYKEPGLAIRTHCRGGVKRTIIDSLGRKQTANFIPERDLYRLVMHSRLPEAERFEEWVVGEVLPSIRKTGGYQMRQLTRLQLIDMARDAELERLEAVRCNDRLIAEKRRMEPLAILGRAVSSDESEMLIVNAVKSLDLRGRRIGQGRLFKFLREIGVLISIKGERYNTPYQQYVDNGMFRIRLGQRPNRDGQMVKTFTPLITNKGLAFVNKKLLEHPDFEKITSPGQSKNFKRQTELFDPDRPPLH
jgi:anti-repressor protein